MDMIFSVHVNGGRVSIVNRFFFTGGFAVILALRLKAIPQFFWKTSNLRTLVWLFKLDITLILHALLSEGNNYFQIGQIFCQQIYSGARDGSVVAAKLDLRVYHPCKVK